MPDEEKKEDIKPVKTIEELTAEMEEHKIKVLELEKRIPMPVVPSRTSPAKEQKSSDDALRKTAQKAAMTGKRQDVAEYMRKRRSVI